MSTLGNIPEPRKHLKFALCCQIDEEEALPSTKRDSPTDYVVWVGEPDYLEP